MYIYVYIHIYIYTYTYTYRWRRTARKVLAFSPTYKYLLTFLPTYLLTYLLTYLQMEAQAAADKEARIEHLTQMAARRMGKKELAMGFEGWAEMALEVTRRRRLLQQAGARLVRPKLAACYSHWRMDWQLRQASERTVSELLSKEVDE